MLKFVNSVLVLCLLVAAFVVYSLEYSIKQDERLIAKAKSEARDARETIKLLDAEWSMLTRPDRLQRLAQKYSKLELVRADQIVKPEALAVVLPARPAPDPSRTPDAVRNDPIANMLKGLNQ